MLTKEEAQKLGYASNEYNHSIVIVLTQEGSIFKSTSVPSDKHYNKVHWEDISPRIAYLKYIGDINDALSLCKECNLIIVSCFEVKGTVQRTEVGQIVYEVNPIVGSHLIEKMLEITSKSD